MNQRMNGLAAAQNMVRWGQAVLIAGGLAWIGRAALEIAFRPDYWNPPTAVDYVAVGGFSLALILLGMGLWAIHLSRHPQTGLRK